MWRIVEVMLDGHVEDFDQEGYVNDDPSWVHYVQNESGYEQLIDVPGLKVTFWLDTKYVISVKEE